MSFETVARGYLSELQKEVDKARLTGASTAELSYRPVLDDFFRKVARLISPEIDQIFEPKNQGKAGRPDWRFYNNSNLGVYGYVEAKGLSTEAPLDAKAHEKQVEKYLNLRHKVILTDGVDFIFFESVGSPPVKLSLVEKPIAASNWKDLRPNLLLEASFRSFFSAPGFRRCSERQLIKEVAKRAVWLSESVEELAKSPLESGSNEEENRAIEILHQLQSVLQEHHDPVLRSPKAFADFVAQVLIFGLLYAHRVMVGENDSPIDRNRKIQEFWSNTVANEHSLRLRPFRALVEMLGEELNSLSKLGVWYGDCRLLLSYIELNEKQIKTPDYHTLYESFLSVFDPQTRFDYGAYYTPGALVEFAVSLVQAIAETEFQDMSLYQTGNKLIDPCCGTGTFLEQLLLRSHDRANRAQIIGFEILPAPYALAYYRISMLGNTNDIFQNMSIILTNTLSDELELEQEPEQQVSYDESASMQEDTAQALTQSGDIDPQKMIDEEQTAARLLARPPLTLVIGNPPSTDSSPHTDGQNFTVIQNLLDDFRPPENRRTTRQNIQKQLQNEFVKFLRWSCNKIVQSSNGLIALVLPASFAEHPSYLYARRWLVENFQKLWILDIDLDIRTGVHTSNLFKTQQGRMLLVGLSRTDGRGKRSQVFYHTIANLTKSEKESELSLKRDVNTFLNMFSSMSYDNETYAFRPKEASNSDLYKRFWALHPLGNEPLGKEKYIFQRHASSVKFGATAMFVHVDRNRLLRRCNEIGDMKNSVDQLETRWLSGQDKPPKKAKFTESVRREIRRAIEKDKGQEAIRLYTYRPLVNVYALVSESVLEALKPVSSGTRSRPEVMSAFESESTIGIAVAPSPKEVAVGLHRFASFCWTIPDNDICRRSNAHVFCNQYPEYKKINRPWNHSPVNNISPELLQRLSAIVGDVYSEDVVFYVYAILCSNAYLQAFKGILYSVKVIPRIPIVADKAVFRSITEKGRRLAELEKPLPNIAISDQFEVFQDLYSQSFKLSKYNVDRTSQSLELQDEFRKVGITVKPIPENVLEFTISGYQVVSQWLKIHSYSYTRMDFSKTQYLELLTLLSRIQMQIGLIEELDKEIVKIYSGEIPIL